MGIKGIAKVARGLFLRCDLHLDSRGETSIETHGPSVSKNLRVTWGGRAKGVGTVQVRWDVREYYVGVIDGDDEPSDDDDDDDTDDEDEEPTKEEDDDEEEEEEEHLDSADSFTISVVNPVPLAGDTEAFKTDEARKTVRLEQPMSASMEARIAEHAAALIPPTSPAYDQVPLGHRAAMIRIRDDIPKEDMPPQRRFVLTAPHMGSLICSPGHDARTIPRAADRAEDVAYVRAL
nr:hypothetical protein [Tanacetum cinerariifolium]